MNQLWQQQAEQLGGQSLVALLTEMRDNQQTMIEKVSSLETTTTRLMSGFPADDVDGHRRYHESVIEWRELRNKLVREALTKMVAAGTLAAVGWLLVAVWNAAKISVTR